MKKIYTTIIIALLSINVFGQIADWNWAKSAVGDIGNDNSNSITTDVNGNVIITGTFQGSSITFGTTTFTSSGGHFFIAKYDNFGNVLWAKSGGGFCSDRGTSVTADSSGNIFVTGYLCSHTATFGTTILTNTDIIGYTEDIFIVKYDAMGNVVWAKSAGGTTRDYAESITTDASGNVIITGYFQSASITFGATTLTNTDTSGTTGDIFTVKYDASGNVILAKSEGGTLEDIGGGVTADASGNVLITGYYFSNTITIGATTLTNPTCTNIFTVKYDATGNVLWAKSAGGYGTDHAYRITHDASGNLFITGDFLSSVLYFGTVPLTNVGNKDVFIAKYDSSGNVVWAKSAGGIGDDDASSITSDANGNVIITGAFRSPTITFGATTLINAGNSDIFIVKYDVLGNVIWAISEGSALSNIGGTGVTTDASGDTFITGNFLSPTVTFGTAILTNADNTGIWSDIFVAKLGITTGIEEIQNNSSVSIYPNPFTSATTITFSEEQKNTTIKVYDVTGRMVNDKWSMVNGKSASIDMSGFAKGVYFVRIEDEKKNIVNRKIITN